MSPTRRWPSSSAWSLTSLCHWSFCWLTSHLSAVLIPATQLSWVQQVTVAAWSPQADHKTETASSAMRPNVCFFSLEGYRWMITPDMLQQTAGLWYIDARLFNSTWVPGLTLRISSFMSKCLYWDEKNETWSTDGCQAGFHSNRELQAFVMFYTTVVCYCNVPPLISGGREKHTRANAVSV